jgi:hypothetical protein
MIRRSTIRTAAALLMFTVGALAAPKRQPVPDPAQDFYTHSDLQSVRTAVQSSMASVSTLFAAMEAAALQLDTPAELDLALRLCELSVSDPRANVAASRILELAANTQEFRAIVPRIHALLAADAPQANTLRAALIAAANDGLPGLDRATLAHNSGLLTDWRIAGPFGRFGNVAYEKSWPAERDALASADYDGRTVEHFRFDDGTFRLPDYFSPDGIFYAVSRLTLAASETRVLRVESPGTLDVQVDGRTVLTKDDRLQATPETVSTSVRLPAGPHDVVVKFIASAVPFRIALVPEPHSGRSTQPFSSDIESAYVAASEKFWAGDYDDALAKFSTLRTQQDSAAVEYMLARTQAQLDQPGERERSLAATLKLAPSADAAAHDTAMVALERSSAEALKTARRIAADHPHSSDAQELLASAAMASSASDADRAIASETDAHPSCAILTEALRYLTASGDTQTADNLARKLEGCAPDSLAYAKYLADNGDHARAAQSALAVARQFSTDRQARAFAVKELMLTGDLPQAKQVARELIDLAPNSRSYADLLAQASDPAAATFATAQEFYRPYRREGVALVRQTSERHYSGGPSVTLLHDRVVQLDEAGGATVYVHRITRVLNRDGIELEGEVSLPLGAEVIELRTIKPDLSTVEPEFNAHKNSVSMPALAAGDAIDAEYVFRVTDLNARPDVMQFDFGSFTAPVVYARYVMLSRPGQQLRVFASKDAPVVGTTRDHGAIVQMWQASDIPQTPRETASAPDSLPFVRLTPYANWSEVRDLYRDVLIDAVRGSPEVDRIAATLKQGDDEQTARAIYSYVKTKIRSSDTAFSTATFPTAEATLLHLSGSRTVAAIALARSAGLKANLLLTREVAKPSTLPVTTVYTRPLVLFTLGSAGQQVAIDFETEGLAFRALPPTLAMADGIYVPVLDEHTPPMVPVPPASSNEESVATGDVTINSAGDLNARVVIQMGPWRAMQMRGVLAGIDPAHRPHFFEQLAARIFPGATGTSGQVRHEHDTDQPLEIEFSTQSPAFLNVQGRTVDLEQLVPALGLRKMYAVDAPHTLPVYLDTPLVERSTFRVNLPPNLVVSSSANDLNLHTEFGDYAATFRTISPGILEVSRTFRVPVQVIAPDHFGAFASFARQIDDAERQRFLLVHAPVSASTVR